MKGRSILGPCRTTWPSIQRRGFSISLRRCQSEVRIVEVGPRDGLQNEAKGLNLETKLELIKRLSATGLASIEAGSFVSPKWVPQMANSGDVLRRLLRQPPHAPTSIAYNFLVPNERGMVDFIEVQGQFSQEGGAESTAPTTYPPQEPDLPPSPPPSPTGGQSSEEPTPTTYPPQDPDLPPSPPPPPPGGQSNDEPAPITSTSDPNGMPSSPSTGSKPETSTKPPNQSHTTEISIFLAATEAFSKANLNCTIAESLERSKEVISLAKQHSFDVRAYISVALGCPYEGPSVAPQRVAEMARTLLEMGVEEVSVADTTGMGTAPKTQELLKALSAAGVSAHDLAFHFHDTYGQALVNVCVGLEHGVRVFDGAVGGLGGCPFSKGATGNVSTEDLVHCMHSLGVHTGVDIEELSRIGEWISTDMGRVNASRTGKAVLARLKSNG